MMETTDLWNGTHFAHRRRLYPARLGRVLLKRVLPPSSVAKRLRAVARCRERPVLPLLSVGETTLRLYSAMNYSQNSARNLSSVLNGA